MPLEPLPEFSQEEQLAIIEPLCAVFRRKLKSEGLKYTPERAAILDAVVQREGLFDADELLAEMKSRDIPASKATLYRTIKLLVEAGIVQRILVGPGLEQARYQLAYSGGGHSGGADLIIRLDTGDALTVRVPGLAELCAGACAERGLTLRGHRLHIFAEAGESRGAGDGGKRA